VKERIYFYALGLCYLSWSGNSILQCNITTVKVSLNLQADSQENNRRRPSKRVQQLTDQEVELLIKLLTNSEETIKSVARINQGFVRELNKRVDLSNRVKHTLKQTCNKTIITLTYTVKGEETICCYT